MPESEQGRYEAEVLRHVLEAWRDEEFGAFEGAGIHAVGIVAEGDRCGVEVRFHMVQQVGHPEHSVRYLVPWPPEQSPQELADDIIYAVWAKANGTY